MTPSTIMFDRLEWLSVPKRLMYNKAVLRYEALNNLAPAYRVKSGKFGHRVNSDTLLQAVEIQMRRLLMSRLIRIFTVCLVNLFFIPIIEL